MGVNDYELYYLDICICQRHIPSRVKFREFGFFGRFRDHEICKDNCRIKAQKIVVESDVLPKYPQI